MEFGSLEVVVAFIGGCISAGLLLGGVIAVVNSWRP